jgi:hypothetical protein
VEDEQNAEECRQTSYLDTPESRSKDGSSHYLLLVTAHYVRSTPRPWFGVQLQCIG